MLEEIEVVFLEEFESGLGGEAEADGEGLVACDAVADCEDVVFENLKGFLPAFGWVNIGAVGEVVLVAKLHLFVLPEQ